ncbi:hypothetical protein RHGRI_005635 [Rhododendron griersonianum]|uniref:Uncharacterized protein n=1 Tax=Rhododendron griersonianum TaxID=479676 RepID=A0AAV6LFM3_9ERIC|nr:hypothetical protein RHGRI_005635 [Rhododendron griersonianum]
MGISTTPKEVTPILVNGSCILLSSDIPSIIGCTNSTLTSEFYFQDSKTVEGGEICWDSQFVDHFWKYFEAAAKKNIWIAYLEQVVANNIAFIFPDSSLQFGVRKINLRYKIDADKVRRIQLYKLEDEFLQDGENDAEWSRAGHVHVPPATGPSTAQTKLEAG